MVGALLALAFLTLPSRNAEATGYKVFLTTDTTANTNTKGLSISTRAVSNVTSVVTPANTTTNTHWIAPLRTHATGTIQLPLPTTASCWIFDTDLTGNTLSAGTWRLRGAYQMSNVALVGSLWYRVSKVQTVSTGTYLIQHLTPGTSGWVQWGTGNLTSATTLYVTNAQFTANATTFNVGQKIAVEYQFRVASGADGARTFSWQVGTSDNYIETSDIADARAPTPVSNLTALTGNADGEVRLSWTSPGDNGTLGTLNDAEYRIRYSTSNFGFLSSSQPASNRFIGIGDIFISTHNTSTGTAVGTTLTGLNPGTTYYFGLITRDESYNWSTFTFTATNNRLSSGPARDLALSAPTLGAFVTADVGTGSMVVDWTNPSPPANIDDRAFYRLYTATSTFSSLANGWIKLSSTVDHPMTSATTHQMQANTLYYFAATSIDSGTVNPNLYSAALESSLSAVQSTATLAVVPGNISFSPLPAETQITSITVSWAPNGNPLTPPTSYQLQVSSSADFVGATLTSSITFLTNSSTANITPNTTYYFRVRAFNRFGIPTGYNTVASTVTLARPPGLTSFNVYNTSITLRLSRNFNPAGTEVAITTGNFEADKSTVGFLTAQVTTLTFTAGQLQPNATYQIRFRAENYLNVASSISATVLSTCTLANDPGTSSFANAPAEVNFTSITVSWDSNGNPPSYDPLLPPTSYQVQISTALNFGTFTSSVTFNTFATTATLSTGTTYYFRVRAFNHRGSTSSFNTILSTITRSYAPLPNVFFSTNVAVSSITFGWGSNGNAAGTPYRLQVSTDQTFGVYSTSDTTTLSASTLTLSGNTTYFFRVAANPFTAFSNSFSTATLPRSPGVVTLAQNVFATSVSVRMTQNGNPAGTPYEASASSTGFLTTDFSSAGALTVAVTTLTLTGLQPNTTYAIGLEANNWSSLSSTRTVTSTTTWANTPGNFIFDTLPAEVEISSITVSWGPNGNPLIPPTSYQLDIANNVSFTGAYSSITFRTSVTTTTLSPNTTYYFRVRAMGRNNIATPFNATASTVTMTTAPGIRNFNIYNTSITVRITTNTNPAGTEVVVTTGNFETHTSTIGRFNVGTTTLTLNGLNPNSTYFVQMRTENYQNVPSTASATVLSTCTLANDPGPGSFTNVPAVVNFTSITVSWGSNGNPPSFDPLLPPTSYQVLISTALNFGSFSSSVTFNTYATTATLNAGTTYYFQVRAFNHRGSTSNFNTAITTVTSGYPPDPNVFFSSNVAVSSISFNWSAGSNGPTTPYRVRISTDPNFGVFTTSDTTSLFVSSINLNASTSYYFRVAAVPYVNFSSVYSTATLARAPGIGSLAGRVFISSIAVLMPHMGNGAGTLYEASASSTGFATTDFSSSGVMTVAVTTLAIQGLQPNTTYSIGAEGINWNSLSSTRTVTSTGTLANVPGNFTFDVLPAEVEITSITVSWDPNGNPLTPPTSYQLQVSSSPNFVGTTLTSSITYLTNSSTANITPNATYYFRVRAFNRFGIPTAYNTIASTVTLARPPGLSSFNVYNTSIAVRLSRNLNPAGTEVTVTTGNFEPHTSTVGFLTSQVTTLTFTTGQLQPNATYQIRFRADNYQNVASSVSATAISTCTLANDPGPGSFTVPPADINLTSVTISWDANGNPPSYDPLLPPTSYQVQISTALNFGSFSSSVTFNTYATTATLDAGTTYYFRVRAFNHLGSTSNFNTAITTVTYGYPPDPNVFFSSNVAVSSINFNWSAGGNGPGTPYRVQVSTDSSFGVFSTSDTNLLFVSSVNLNSNTTYHFRIAPPPFVNFSSAFSTATYARAPGILAFTGRVGTSSVTVIMPQTGNPANTLYEASASSTGFLTTDFSTAGALRVAHTTLTISGLQPNTTYSIGAVAFNWHSQASTRTVTSTTTLANTPGNFTFDVLPDEVQITSITVSWDPNGNPLIPPTSYQLQIANNASFTAPYSSVTFLTRVTTTALIPNTTYFFRVRAMGRNNLASPFNTAVATATLSRAPGLFNFSVYAASISVRMTTNTNPAGTEVAVTTGNFEAHMSTSGRFNTAVTTLTFLNTLRPNTTYQIRIRTENYQNIPSSASATVISTATLPTVPGASTATAVNTSSITVAWTSGGNSLDPPTSYYVQISTDINFGAYSSSTTFELDVTTDTLLSNTSYYFRVKAVGVGGSSSTYNAVLTTATMAAVPSGIVFSPQPGYVSFSSIAVDWQANGNPLVPPTSYQMQVSNNSGFSTFSSSITFNTYADSATLIPNTTYFFRVRAINARGAFSDFSNIFSTATLARAPGFRSFNVYNTSITVRVTTNTNPAGTEVTVTTGNFEPHTSTTGFFNVGITTLTLNNLQANTTYLVQFRTENYQGIPSSASATVLSTATLPNIPSLSSFSVVNVTSITVSWNNNGNSLTPPTSYQMFISSSSNFAAAVLSSSVTFNVFATTQTLQANASYYFRVQAMGIGGSSSTFDSTISTYTMAAIPATSASTFTYVGLSSITAQWLGNGNPAQTLYRVDISTWIGFANAVTSSFTYRLDVTTTGLMRDTTYYFRVKALNQRSVETNYLFMGSTSTYADEIGVLIVGGTYYNFGLLEMSVSSVSVSSFTIQNIGNVQEDYALSATTLTANSPWALGSSASTDQLVLRAGFNPARPLVTDFGSEDVIQYSNQTASGSVYSLGTSSGVTVPINDLRYLWMRLDMPLITSTTNQQTLRVTITGAKSP